MANQENLATIQFSFNACFNWKALKNECKNKLFDYEINFGV